MTIGGRSTYEPGSSTTTIQAGANPIDPTAALMALLAAERRPVMAPPPAPMKVAAPTAPVQISEPGVQYSNPAPRGASAAQAASALANRPSFVHLSGVGPQQVSGWTDAPEGAGSVFGGWRVTDGGGPVHVAESGNISDHMRQRGAQDLGRDEEQFAFDQTKQQTGGNQRADFYGLNQKR